MPVYEHEALMERVTAHITDIPTLIHHSQNTDCKANVNGLV